MAKRSRHFTIHECRALYSEKSRAFGQGFGQGLSVPRLLAEIVARLKKQRRTAGGQVTTLTKKIDEILDDSNAETRKFKRLERNLKELSVELKQTDYDILERMNNANKTEKV